MADAAIGEDPMGARVETKEEKKARVASHRQEVLRRMQQEQNQQKIHKQTVFICPVEMTNT
jgi:hypothetical protein